MIGPSTPTSDLVLAVDDDDANRYAVSRTLRHAGFRVIEAASGHEALQKAAQSRPDLIVLDVQLPDIDGFEVCRRLRQASETKHVPVVHLTAHAVTVNDRVTGLEGGAAAYLVRPIETRELLATIRSLLDVHRAEQVARRTAREWQATFDAIPEAIYLLDAVGAIVRANMTMLERCREHRIEQVIGASHRVVVGALIDEWPSDIPDSPMERRVQRDIDARGLVYRWTVDSVLDDAGEVVGAVGILADVTESRQLARAVEERNLLLQAADRAKDDFLAMLSHELRNPLGAIAAAMSVLRDATGGEGSSERVRLTAQRQIRHLARLIEDLLDASRVTRGKIDLRRELLDVGVLVDQATDLVRDRLAMRNQTLRFEPPAVPIRVLGDAVRLEQVVVNLLDNASKFTPSGGTIEIALAVEGNSMSLSVRDTGTGIARGQLASIFEAFVQVNPPIDRSQGGLGLGLTMARTLVDLHGGTIEARSEGLGRGSIFEVRLPLADDESAPVGPTPQPASSNDVAPRVMVIEDDEDNRTMMRFMLEQWGIEVLEAADGKAGIEMVTRERPTHALIDIGLPGVDGFEVARRIRKTGTPIQLIALTGYGSENDRARASDAGFDHHLLKPVDADVLMSLLRTPPPPARAAEGDR